MATPLYKRFKNRGTSFYAFPSSASDLNLANNNNFYNINFTKFALLNIPRQVNAPNPNDGILDLTKDIGTAGPFYCDDPNIGSPTKLSEQLVESLRNYVANYDTSLHESRINNNTDFYNIGVRDTPTEMIFWKWCRKLNLIDFEPAVHNVDWDKSLPDFDNPNNSTITNTDYFRKYLWKERESGTISNPYQTVSVYEDSVYLYEYNNTPKFAISGIAKFKVGDKVILTTDNAHDKLVLTGTTVIFGQDYIIGFISYDSNTNTTYINLNTDFNGGGGTGLTSTYIYLDYNRLIQYVGEINQITNVQTASRVGQEITAYIPHQGGKTPTVLFGTKDNNNYNPNLEIPILANEIQNRIVGSESLNSPIRSNPSDYPGSSFGQFDTSDYTYLCSNGDRLRYQGEYYGVLLTDNAGLSANNYVEKLTDFNSDSLDGIFLDVDRYHYKKMNIPAMECQNFDEFSSLSINGAAPADFDFNAILWYYDLSDQNNNSAINLYGIEFLNTPENDDDNFGNLITPYHKLVSNGKQDGLSYMFNININYNIDNDVVPLTYDPSTIYNMFGFDMYNEMMRKFYQVNENFVSIIQNFVRINMDLQEMKSLIYSQTDMDELKSRMSNMENLLTLYKNNQFVDSDTATIAVDNSGVYPMLKFNVVNVEYNDIQNISLSYAYNYNVTSDGLSYPFALSTSGKMLLNIINDNVYNNGGDVIIMLDKDLKNKQKLDIIIKPQYALYTQNLTLTMKFNSGNTLVELPIITIASPIDTTTYNSLSPDHSVFTDSYYLNENVYTNTTDINTGFTWCTTGNTEVVLTEDLFKAGDIVYIQNLYFLDTAGNTIDYSGAYEVLCKSGIVLTINLKQSQVQGYKLLGVPRVSYYRGIQLSILRVNNSNTSSFSERYDVTYKIL
jgi:hypothetical protein